MEAKQLTVKAKVSFPEAAANLVQLCHRIDEGGDLDQELIQLFAESQAHLVDSIDRRKAFYAELESKIQLAKDYKKQADEHLKRFQRIQDRLKEITRTTIEKHPDLPYRDSFGAKVSVVKSSTPALVLEFDMTASKSFSNILDPDCVSLLGIDDKYLKHVSFVTLDTEAVKEDLKSGVELLWARLNYSTYLRGL